ncbi:hypothetical protein NC653_035919 [Populus alba x Populus x berolinensis]|uniref:Uncharacterized protein n=1 Tax=Populus alba x Populus x berolinensis TaxID=444605 RepID=A0AAD6PV53_9ROSI|nr:hypothetical protein NC653_035919 [Populus alba x Populus x berolinensis]
MTSVRLQFCKVYPPMGLDYLLAWIPQQSSVEWAMAELINEPQGFIQKAQDVLDVWLGSNVS